MYIISLSLYLSLYIYTYRSSLPGYVDPECVDDGAWMLWEIIPPTSPLSWPSSANVSLVCPAMADWAHKGLWGGLCSRNSPRLLGCPARLGAFNCFIGLGAVFVSDWEQFIIHQIGHILFRLGAFSHFSDWDNLV